jgi:hypothetical protein
MLNRRECSACDDGGGASHYNRPGRLAWAQVSGQTDTPRLALKGYDAVAYFTEGGRRSASLIQYPWDEARYRFASAQHMTLFRAEPDRYAHQLPGHVRECPWA